MYMSQWLLKNKKTISGDISNPYNLHKLLWKTFPGHKDEKRNFLFRIDSAENGHFVLMLSENKPVETVDIRLVRIAEPRLVFTKGAKYSFSLRANPVKRLSVERCRVPLVGEDNISVWLQRKFGTAATLIESMSVKRSDLNFCKENKWGKVTAIDFQGLIQCENPELLKSIVQNGIGAAKAFGCGLLLLKRE